MLEIDDQLQIDDAELIERFVRASGPGGQNVNKVASAVELRFDVVNSAALRDRRLTAEGVLVIQASRFRDQAKNREDARARLVELIRAAQRVPKKRVATKPTRASKERRISEKKNRAGIKSHRGRQTWSGD